MKQLVCFHLFNDFSGSPTVLRMVLNELLQQGYRIDLVTSRGGVLDSLDGKNGIRLHRYLYHFSPNPVWTFCRYGIIQLYTFLWAFRWIFDRNTVFYINTLLPVGPALAGRLMGKRVVYHYHENAFVKSAFYRILARWMQRLAHEIICVSHYQASFLTADKKVIVVPNALPKAFVAKLNPDVEAAFHRKTILMLSSLKAYKGTNEFIRLSERMPQYSFVLVINDTQNQIDSYLQENRLDVSQQRNLKIYPRQNDVTSFYNQASLVLNLSNKRLFIETFGMTALEAMAAGLPVIVPTIGGIAEMVEDGVNGYRIDVQDQAMLEKRIHELLSQKETYIKLAHQALLCACRFNVEEMVQRIIGILNKSD